MNTMPRESFPRRYLGHALLWGAALVAVMWITGAAAQTLCATTQSITESVKAGKVRLVGQGLDFAGNLVRTILLPGPDGYWVVWVTPPGAETSCSAAGGSGWQDGIAEAPDGDPA